MTQKDVFSARQDIKVFWFFSSEKNHFFSKFKTG